MRKLAIILVLLAIIFIAGCQRGITGQAVRDVDQQTTATTAPSTVSTILPVAERCSNGIVRKETLANGTVREYCYRQISSLKKCDIEGQLCSKFEECINGYCRPRT